MYCRVSKVVNLSSWELKFQKIVSSRGHCRSDILLRTV